MTDTPPAEPAELISPRTDGIINGDLPNHDRPEAGDRVVDRITGQLAGVSLTAEQAEQIVDAARARIGASRPAPLTPVEQTREHEHTAECRQPGSACPDASS